MSVYLPIAEMPVSALLLILASGLVGFVSGLVGVGGGFIMTPALIFVGVPSPVAVATAASQVAATSLSGLIPQAQRRNVDWRMGLLLSTGGVVGSVFGVSLFSSLLAAGQVDVLIAILYFFLLAGTGSLMLVESLSALRARKAPPRPRPSLISHGVRTIAHILPLRMRFPRSGLYISVLPPLGLGFVIGALAAVMGVGGSFILVPAMIYLLRMPTNVVIGTSLFQVMIVGALVTILQATVTQQVDILLAALLMVGGVIGAQLGSRFGARLRAEQLRAVLGIVLAAASLKFLFDLVVTPGELFVLSNMP